MLVLSSDHREKGNLPKSSRMAEAASVDLSSVPGQVGTLVIGPDGNVYSATGELSDSQHTHTVQGLLHDTSKILKTDPFKRITLSYDKVQYVITVDGRTRNIYVVKKR
eukprot:comp12284_c0_seq1/m.7110 comp12284_c0_seq1/g.7110  ORF comp12284_c0_seq1/g.7110 comp12284_c0_seq1/m.7110 type:complete len:108 (-) comp12284_c0_seq1:161-484(-)